MADRCVVIDLAAHRPLPLPWVTACVGGSVAVTLGSGDHEIEDHLDLRQARALLLELSDAIEIAEWIERVGKEAERR